jgi:hypothetical protein
MPWNSSKISKRTFSTRATLKFPDDGTADIPPIVHTKEHPPGLQRPAMPEGFLDAEAAFDGRLSIVGIYRTDMGTIQLVGDVGITYENLRRYTAGLACLYTYSGRQYDLVQLERQCSFTFEHHVDLLDECLKIGLRGGLKQVEVQLGIERRTAATRGQDAPLLWRAYVHEGHRTALRRLLDYNYEDTVNLALVRHRMANWPSDQSGYA